MNNEKIIKYQCLKKSSIALTGIQVKNEQIKIF